jgi:hypothetical protein
LKSVRLDRIHSNSKKQIIDFDESKIIFKVVGWYATGDLLPNSAEHNIGTVINDLKEASLLLKIDPFKNERSNNELPMALFELEPYGGLSQKAFVLEAKDAEQVKLLK